MIPGIKIDEKRRIKLARSIMDTMESDIQARIDAMQDSAIVRGMYYGNSGRDILPYVGASDIHLPVITDKVETFVPKAKSALTGADPVVRMRRAGNEEFNEDDTRDQEDFLNWALDSDVPGFDEVIEGWVRNACLDPVSVVKIYWDQQWRDTAEVTRVKAAWRPGDTDITGQVMEEESIKSADEILTEVFGMPPKLIGDDGLISVEEDGDTGYIVTFVEGRRLYQNARVEITESEYIDEVDVTVFRPILVRDSARVDNIEFEDLIVPFRATNLQECSHITQQYWMDFDDIDDKRKSGEWAITDEDMELLRKERTRTMQEHMLTQDNKMVRDDAAGESDMLRTPIPSLAPFKGGKILMLECYTRDDVASNGRTTEVIYQMPMALEKVVRADYLDAMFPHGRRPFADLRYLPLTDRWSGISMGRLLIGIQQQVNITINQINDNQELINHPFFFYEPAAVNLDPTVLENVEPGQGIPVANTGAVLFPQWTQQPLANLSSGLDPVLLFADRLTTSAMSSGSPQIRNAPRTARGTFALLGESNNKIDMFVRRAQKGGWQELIHQIYSLYQYYGPEEKWYYVVGTPKRKSISAKRMRGRYDYIFSGNVINTNPEMKRALAQQRFAMARQDPLYNADPLAAQALLRDMLSHMSEGSTNIEVMIPRIQQQGSFGFPMTPRHSIMSMAQGIMVQAHPADDHAAHIDAIQKFVQSQNFDNVDPAYVPLFATNMHQHQQFLAQAQAQAQAERGFAAGGAEQTVSPGLESLEGGVQ